MITITCDICGGTLSMDASGEFATCDSCGMKHTKDRVKAKAQADHVYQRRTLRRDCIVAILLPTDAAARLCAMRAF